MKKDLILKLIFTVLELTDILALLYYFKSELNKTKQTLGEQENINQNSHNDNANDFDFRCHAIEKLKGERDRLIEELKKDTKAALEDDSPDLSKALGALAEDLENLSKANKDLEWRYY